MKIYQIDCSARKEGSTSRMLAKKILDKVKKDNDEVIYRDLDDEMLFISGLTESGMKIPENEQTDEHKKMFELSDKLVSELKECDVIIISVPIYNFGPPATLKAWADLAARVKLTFKYGDDGRRKGLLEDKQVYLVITSGGNEPVVDSVGGNHSLFALKFIDTSCTISEQEHDGCLIIINKIM